MSQQREIEGYDTIQCSEISSTTDVLFLNPRFVHFPRFPVQRKSYRNLHTRMVIVHNAPNPNGTTPNRGTTLEALSTKTASIYVALIFILSIFALLMVYTNFPQLTDEEKVHIRIPWNIEQAKQLGFVLNRYKDDNFYQVLTGVFITYIFLQTFAIPGSLFLSILSGFLFPFYGALVLVCTCSAIGASLCFLLSQLLGRKLVLKYFPERARKWAVIVDKHRDNLFNYIVFLRVTPFLPNWFINLTAPVIGVPLKPFALGTFFGVAPPSCVAIQAGQTLHTLSATDSTVSWTSIIILCSFAVLSLVPILLKKRLKDKFD